MEFLNSLNIGGSALTAQKLRMDIISQNIANADTTRTQSGGPYKRKMVVLTSRDGASFSSLLNKAGNDPKYYGVSVTNIIEDNEGFKPVYNPSHPDADANGYVMMPNVDTTKEMVDMISATRSYEASVTAFNAVKLMATKALDIGK
ncbi:MAG TPA: flagellar basal body rod protein FlgC [Clostridia bacterium]|jgi:flagellar basal-body rod protein FlgC|nr:flagellar basal body rod protein FlgC [Clostridia bacterium]